MKDGRETLKHFDNIFNTETIKNIKFDNMKLLKALYDYFEEDIYTPSNKYSTLRHKHIEISENYSMDGFVMFSYASLLTKEGKKEFRACKNAMKW